MTSKHLKLQIFAIKIMKQQNLICTETCITTNSYFKSLFNTLNETIQTVLILFIMYLSISKIHRVWQQRIW
jgi:hypothetical protein